MQQSSALSRCLRLRGGFDAVCPPDCVKSLSDPLGLLDLPDDLLALLCVDLVQSDLQAARRLVQVSRAAFAAFAREVQRALINSVLRWQAERSYVCTVTEDAKRLASSGVGSWAVCAPLPLTGRHSWTVQIVSTCGNSGGMSIGVCNSEGLHAWGLNPCHGEIWRVIMHPLRLQRLECKRNHASQSKSETRRA